MRAQAAPLCLVLMAVATPLFTVPVNVFFGLLLLASLWHPGARAFWSGLKSDPLLAWCVLGLLWVVFAALWSNAPVSDIAREVSKYRKLLIIPLAVVVIATVPWRDRLGWALHGALALVLLATLTQVLGLHDFGKSETMRRWVPAPRYDNNFFIFKSSIAQSLQFAWLAFAASVYADFETRTLYRRIAWGLALASVVALLWFTKGRTGQAVFAALLVLWLVCRRGRPVRGISSAWSLSLAAICLVAALLWSSGLRETITRSLAELDTQRTPTAESSFGLRFTFWREASSVWAEHPLVGGGTASLPHRAPPVLNHLGVAEPLQNAHNQFLHSAAEGGLVFVAWLLVLLLLLWRRAALLPPREGILLRGIVLWLAVGCLVNSLLRDFSEGHFFVLVVGWLLSATPRAHQP